MDNQASCCEEARMKIIEWFEEHIEKIESASYGRKDSLKESLITTSQELSEDSCDDLYENVTRFMGMYDLKRSTLFDGEALEKIVNDWDKCKEEPMADKEPVKDTNNLEWHQQTADSQTAWMDKYFATGRN